MSRQNKKNQTTSRKLDFFHTSLYVWKGFGTGWMMKGWEWREGGTDLSTYTTLHNPTFQQISFSQTSEGGLWRRSQTSGYLAESLKRPSTAELKWHRQQSVNAARAQVPERTYSWLIRPLAPDKHPSHARDGSGQRGQRGTLVWLAQSVMDGGEPSRYSRSLPQ